MPGLDSIDRWRSAGLRSVFCLNVILLSFASAVSADQPNTPNIVIILADDLGYGDVQCLNPDRGKISTPNLDRLASQGITLTDAHAGSSVCTPTRYGLLTGRYAWRTRLQSGVLDGGNEEPLISESRLTLPALLRSHGYATACIGKWHLGFQSESQAGSDPMRKGIGSSGLPLNATIIGGPTDRGFDYFWGCSNARTMSSLIENERVIEFVPPIEMMPKLTSRAISYIAERATTKPARPFFLYVPLTAPHSPIFPAPAWQGKSDLGAYGDFVMQTDDSVGRILAALDEHSFSQDTLVICTSDNGCAISAGTAEMEKLGHYTSAQYRGYKTDIWEGGHRMPFFARWPGVIPAGASSDALFCFTDVYATVAEILNATLPEDSAEDSISQLSVLRGDSSVPPREHVIHHSQGGYFAIRRRAWKLALCAGSGGASNPKESDVVPSNMPPWQLYHLSDNPSESKNLYEVKKDLVNELSLLIMTDVDNGRSTAGSPQANDVFVKTPAHVHHGD